jgi:predicted ester cyclase
MMTRRALALCAATLSLAFIPVGSAPRADDRAVVEAFYRDYLDASGPKDKAAVAAKMMAPDWKSIGDYSGKSKSGEALTKQILGFHQLIPDLSWKLEEILQSGNRYVVRGRASGTPKGPLFGVDGGGKSFTIMSIDIHEVVNGRITTTYHVEDWAGALQQLSSK